MEINSKNMYKLAMDSYKKYINDKYSKMLEKIKKKAEAHDFKMTLSDELEDEIVGKLQTLGFSIIHNPEYDKSVGGTMLTISWRNNDG